VWTLTPSTTVGRAINAASERLQEAGIDTARLDAQVILAHVLGVGRSWLFAHFDQALTGDEAENYTNMIARRMAFEPVAYLVGRKEFYGIDLAVDRRVLVPRPETELLVDAVLEHVAEFGDRLTIADIGAGSGAIALAIAANAPEVTIYAIDVSADALAVAKANVLAHDIRGQVTLLHGDLLAPLTMPVDVLVANLPYVAYPDFCTLAPDVRVYEPRLALEAGPQGLDVITRLVHQVPTCLNPGGLVALEIGYDQAPAVVKLIERALPYAYEIDVRKDYQGHNRVVTFRL
jgi:release factor glutamine methyltransferase